jgi:HD-like signal output (HDOD) protein
MSLSIETIRTEIHDAIKNDDLVLPTMPEVALRLRDVADDPDSNASSIAKVIGTDAALTARIIRVANSPLVRGVQNVEDLQMAVSRMGIAYTSNLAIGIAMEQLFQATSDAVDTRMRQTWEHSTEVASLSHVLCHHFTKLRPDEATLAGLVHEIGKLPILVWADYNDWDDTTIDQVTDKLHPELGKMILDAWDFPSGILNVPVEFTSFSRANDTVDYIDVVMVANLQSYVGSDHPYSQLDWSQIPAFENLGMSVDIIMAENDEFSEKVSAARDLLN